MNTTYIVWLFIITIFLVILWALTKKLSKKSTKNHYGRVINPPTPTHIAEGQMRKPTHRIHFPFFKNRL